MIFGSLRPLLAKIVAANFEVIKVNYSQNIAKNVSETTDRTTP